MFELRISTHLDTKEVLEKVQKASIEAKHKCALLVEAEAKKLLSKGGSKLQQQSGMGAGLKKIYIPSPPGEPPRLKSGNLRNSIATARTEKDTYVVGPSKTAFYGQIHEFGRVIKVTPRMRMWLGLNLGIWLKKETGTIHIPPRPFMKPALLKVMSRFPEQFRNLPIGGAAGGEPGGGEKK